MRPHELASSIKKQQWNYFNFFGKKLHLIFLYNNTHFAKIKNTILSRQICAGNSRQFFVKIYAKNLQMRKYHILSSTQTQNELKQDSEIVV